MHDIAYIIISCFIGVLATSIGISSWIKITYRLGFLGKDMNKPDKPLVPEAGGVWVAVGASFGILTLIALYRYVDGCFYKIESFMALSLLLFMASFLGFLDDILGWKKGLRARWRILFMGLLALPLVVIKAGVSTMSLPFLGQINLGWIYPLVLVPIGILGASNAFNMLAGYNGLEAGMGFILMVFTAVYSWAIHVYYVSYAAIIMASTLAVFLYYNWYPARVFPGNSMTYGVGAYYASLVILGNFEKFGVLLFTLYFIELVLFLRGLKNGVYKENFGIPDSNGFLKPPYPKTYSLTHFAIKFLSRFKDGVREADVVVFLLALQLIVGVLSMILVLGNII